MKNAIRWTLGIFVLSTAGFAGAAGVAGAQSASPSPSAAKSYEAVSLFGRILVSPEPSPAALRSFEQARKNFEADPTEDNCIWLGRRTAYLGRFREAIGVYTEGLKKYPDSYRLYRHRGHRYISIRQFGRAAADFEKAAALVGGKPLEVEPDGAPNPTGIPVSNTQFNIYYHLGLARYLIRDFAKAEAAYRECLHWSKNDDSVVAVTDWLYMTLRRTGKTAEAKAALAPVRRGLKLLENGAYLERLLMFKGEISEEDFGRDRPGESAPEKAIRAYGLGMARLWRGDKTGTREIFGELLLGGSWASFAAIAAEVELADLVRADPDLGAAGSTLTAWTLGWNLYDLDLVRKLFSPVRQTSYFSSEKPGRIQGYEALMAHHRDFGFVPGGKTSDNRLWLDSFNVWGEDQMALVTAFWYFDRDVAGPGPVQKGPVTFVFVRDGDAWRIVHAHFANDPTAPAVK